MSFLKSFGILKQYLYKPFWFVSMYRITKNYPLFLIFSGFFCFCFLGVFVCLFVFKFGYRNKRLERMCSERQRISLIFPVSQVAEFRIQIRQSLIRANPMWRREFVCKGLIMFSRELGVRKHSVHTRTEGSWRPGRLKTTWSKALSCSIHVDDL